MGGVNYYVRLNTGRLSAPTGGVFDFHTPKPVIAPSLRQPANQNLRPPRAANDNVLGRALRLPAGTGAAGQLARFIPAARLAGRLVPYLGWFLLTIDLLRWWRGGLGEPVLNDLGDGWIVDCGTPTGTPYGHEISCGIHGAAFIGEYYSRVGRSDYVPPVAPFAEFMNFITNQFRSQDLVSAYMEFDVMGLIHRPIPSPGAPYLPAIREQEIPVSAPAPAPFRVPTWIWKPVIADRPEWDFDVPPWGIVPRIDDDWSSDGSTRGYNPPKPRPPQYDPFYDDFPAPREIEIEVRPDGRVDLSTRPRHPKGADVPFVAPPASSGRPREPRPDRTKEVKTRAVTTAGMGVRIAFDLISEVDDLADAFFDAIPKKFRELTKAELAQQRAVRADGNWKPGYRKVQVPLQHKIAEIYRNWEHIDFDKAIENMTKNEIGDRTFGTIGRAMKGPNKQLGRPVGYQMGPAI